MGDDPRLRAKVDEALMSGDLDLARRIIDDHQRRTEHDKRVERCPFVTVLRCTKDEFHSGLHRHHGTDAHTGWFDPR